ncbi:hypothetical protein FO440_22600 [Mucilaginibacter corticis]|uniref:DNA-binding protein n=1 Tax=Mucilaginibacter corticis TaxID=2597670 RepID=A0A556M9N7_9SPHI|nr:hypothetical protein [Mucilaginibacter corticis]TSJ36620.1 hypothetical protein FO440_22600 [Mucilaginibacter corticis]
MSFDRDNYYSLTEIQVRFDLSPSNVGKLLDEHKPPVIENKMVYGTYYDLTAKYYLKEDIEKILRNSN